MALPGGCVRDENPALVIRIFQNDSRCACQRTCTNPWLVALWCIVPADRVLVVSLLARHKLDTLLAEDILDMWQTIDAGNKAAQLCSRTTLGTCT